MPITREKFIIPFELGGLIEFGEQKFRPFIKFGIGYNYAEYLVSDYQRFPENVNSLPTVITQYKTSILASWGIGMGAYYFINDELKVGINFMSHQVNDANKYIRLLAGVSYII